MGSEEKLEPRQVAAKVDGIALLRRFQQHTPRKRLFKYSITIVSFLDSDLTEKIASE